MTWPTRRISDLCELAVDCVNKTAPTVDYETEFKMIRTTNVKGGFIDLDQVRYVTEEVFKRWSQRSKPKHGDVILTREAPVGAVGRFTSTDENVFLGQRLFHYRPDPKVLNWNFLAYVLQSPSVQGRFKGMGFGATVAHVRVGDAKNLMIPCPPLGTQKRIGHTLSAYDDLIENNRRRIQLLEQGARLLYKEWFGNLRFPGHEHVKVVDGVPEGWRKVLFASELKFHIGGGWGQDSHTSIEGEPAYVIRGTDFRATRSGQFRQVGLRYHKEASLRRRRLGVGDIIFEVSGGSANQPVGRTLLVTSQLLEAFPASMICASFCKRLVPRDEQLGVYLFLFLDRIRSTGELLVYKKDSASALQNFNFKAFLESQHVLIPPAHLLREFSDLVWELQKQATNLAVSIDRLAKARDLLLPRLMNGEIPV